MTNIAEMDAQRTSSVGPQRLPRERFSPLAMGGLQPVIALLRFERAGGREVVSGLVNCRASALLTGTSPLARCRPLDR